MAGGSVHLREPVALLQEEFRQDGGPKHTPHSQAHTRRVHPLRKLFIHERVYHGQVTLDTDADKRHGRAVQVSIETSRDHSAGSLPEHPVVSMEMVLSLEEEGEEEEEVRDGQAAVEDSRGHFSDFSRQRAQDGDVGWDPDGDDQNINNRDDLRAQRAEEIPHCAVTQRPQ